MFLQAALTAAFSSSSAAPSFGASAAAAAAAQPEGEEEAAEGEVTLAQLAQWVRFFCATPQPKHADWRRAARTLPSAQAGTSDDAQARGGGFGGGAMPAASAAVLQGTKVVVTLARKSLGLKFEEPMVTAPPTVRDVSSMKEIDNLNSRSDVKVQAGMAITSARGWGAGQEVDTRGMTAKEMIGTLKSFDLPWVLTFEQAAASAPATPKQAAAPTPAPTAVDVIVRSSSKKKEPELTASACFWA